MWNIDIKGKMIFQIVWDFIMNTYKVEVLRNNNFYLFVFIYINTYISYL